MSTGLIATRVRTEPERENLTQEEAHAKRRDVMERIVKVESMPYFKGQTEIARRLYAEKRHLDMLLNQDES